MAEPLTQRLRSANKGLHEDVEEQVGLPGTVRSRADYVALLQGLLGFHSSLEQELAAPRWQPEWASLGLDLGDYRRSPLIRQDLVELGEPADSAAGEPIGVTTFPQALGALYVAEGSSLGGRFLAPQFLDAVGPVPVAFFQSEGRGHPDPWRTLRAAIDGYGEAGADGDDVVAGARIAFEAFRTRLASPQWAGRG
ncbi:biliverdin-producing heme oxygenase [Naasia aerilata]|uniref:biliverdin-producing heme oxygenase n=1 Tax=Naasia aerilata TaxID=1162966 RepID=UPI0033062818